jgi:hypothetical protein
MLVKHGWLTKYQLGLAIAKQRELGGRLGTCLLEMGCISENLLDRTLSEQQGLPFASAADLAAVPESVIRLLPAPLAIRYRAIPFKASHSEIDMAMLEVDNLWLQDELSFIVGRRLSIHIANEARIVEALARYYGAPCSERFTLLLRYLNRPPLAPKQAETPVESRLARAASAVELERDPRTELKPETAAAPSREPPPPAAVTGSAKPNRSTSIPLSPQELHALGAAPARSGSEAMRTHPAETYSRDLRSASTLRADRGQVDLDQVSSTEEIGQVLLSSLARRLDRVALFQVTPVAVKSWLARGPGLDERRFRDLRIPLDRPSIFLNLRAGGSFFLGLLPEMPSHLELAACWQKDLADECVVFPVRVRNRLVAAFYGDRGPIGLADLDLRGLQTLAASAAKAFERCILEQKKRRGSHARSD